MSNNSYEKKARKEGILSGLKETAMAIDSVNNQRHPTQGKPGASALEFLKDLGLGVFGGALVAKFAGRASTLWGIPISYLGYLAGSRSLTALGLGTMAYGASPALGVSGPSSAGFKEKLHELGEEFKYRFYLDKILKNKKTETQASPTPPVTTPVSGTEQVRYFMYPQTDMQGPGDLDMSALDRLNAQVEESAKAYRTENPEKPQAVSGLGAAIGELLNERII